MTSVHLDGARGEGGGQIVRSALALSLVTGKPFTLVNIRARRDRPGLQRQHLTAVRAAAQLGQAELKGDQLGSQKLTFHPAPPSNADRGDPGARPSLAGDYQFRIGTAGSTTLVLQTLVPALLLSRSASQLRLEGGTHNVLAPPFDYLTCVYFPLLRRMNVPVVGRLERHGFYPAGGGQVEVTIADRSKPLQQLQLIERGALRKIRVTALVANLPQHIAQRECQTVHDVTGWTDGEYSIEYAAQTIQNVTGPGNVLLIEMRFEQVTELFTGFGRKGVRAETVAKGAAEEALAYLHSEQPVGPHLADQIMLPIALATYAGCGTGKYRTAEMTDHAKTHIDVIERFLNVHVSAKEQEGGKYVEVEVSKKA